MSDQQRLDIKVHDGVADVRLSRADKMNALDPAMFDAIESCGRELAALSGLRAVVLSGDGRAFCAGLDFASFRSMAAGSLEGERLDTRTHGVANRSQHIVRLWRMLPVPVIAAVHGVAFGGGFQLMLGADIRIVAPDTRLCIMEVQWGLVPDMAGLGLMRRLARDDVVRELTFSGREFSGEEALRHGFATRLSETPRAEALTLAAEIAGRSPDAVRAAKRLLNFAGEAGEADLLLAEAVAQQALLSTPNQIEAADAKLTRRAPRFIDPPGNVDE